MLLTLFISSLIVMDDMILSPTINTLYEKFPGSTGLINFIVTGCYIFVVVLSLVIGKLCSRYDSKLLMIIGGVIGLAGGILMIFMITPAGLAAGRGLIMISYTFTMNVAIAIISDVYTDDERRGRVMGYYTGTMQGIGAVLAFTAGILATHSLRAVYSLHLLIIPYLIMLFLFVPSFSKMKIAEAGSDAEADERQGKSAESVPVKAKKERFGLRYWVLVLNFSLYNFAFCIPLFYVSVYIAENGLGTEAVAGTINTLITSVGFFTPLLYASVCKRLGKNASTVVFILSAVGCALLLMTSFKSLVFLGFGIIGGACPFIRTWVYDSVPRMVPESRINDAIGYVTSLSTVISTVTAYIVTWGMTTFHFATITSFLAVPIAIFVINVVVDIMMRAVKRPVVRENAQ